MNNYDISIVAKKHRVLHITVKPSIISTVKLNVLLRLHSLPIKQVVYLRSYSIYWNTGI